VPANLPVIESPDEFNERGSGNGAVVFEIVDEDETVAA
jgi:hypothetical protein